VIKGLMVALSAEGLQLLREFEGCRLVAYPDPGSGAEPWTVGYGHIGAEVTPGLVISAAQAEAWLLQDVATAEGNVDRLLPEAGLNRWQREALVSFCFNVGAGALADSTLRKRLLEGEPAGRVLEEELPRWVKGAGGVPLPGLVRRRQQELAHSRRQDTSTPEETPPIELLQAVEHHRGLEHQCNAWRQLQKSLTAEQLLSFACAYRSSTVSVATEPSVPAPPETPVVASALLELPVPYYAQTDSTTGQGSRMCFSSTCAMAAEFLRPGCLQGDGQRDDHYLTLVERHGDTTDATAQIQTLAELGIEARLHQDGDRDDLLQQLQRRVPVPVGWLHKGPVEAPSGGGHWSLVIGWDATTQQLLVHDPNGEADLIHGGYLRHDGGGCQRYSWRNWSKRWMVEGEGSGWWLQLER
jgi:GH24 family phage-related lysozyme (muramidase)